MSENSSNTTELASGVGLNVIKEEKPEEVKAEETKSDIKVEEVKSEEVKVEEKKGPLDLVQLLSSKIIGKEMTEIITHFTFKVDEQVIKITKKVLEKSPESLNKIVSAVNDIMSDGVIDHKDMPRMLLLVTNLFKADLKKTLSDISFTSKDIIEFIKFLIKSVIEFDLVKVSDKKNAFEMIDVSGELLEIVLPENQIKVEEVSKSFCSCFNFSKKK